MSVKVNRTAQRYSGGSTTRSPRMVLLHTTEGVGWPSYNGGAYAPHATIKPIPGKGIEVREHIPFNQSAKALANKAGGVETNRAGVLQFELMGTSDENFHDKYGWYYWPRADDAVMKALADYLKPIMTKYGIPLRCSVTFKDYNRGRVPSSYGLSNGVRMSFSAWNSYKGICGHQHCPENDHGDPGDFDVKALIRHLGGTPATGSTATVKTYTRDDVKRFQRVHGVDDDGYWGSLTEKQAQAIRRVVKPGMKAGPWDLVRYWRLIYTRPKGKRTAASLRAGIQWALDVDTDSIWGPATDAAWLAIRAQHKRS